MDMELVRRIRLTGIQNRLRPVAEIRQRRGLRQAVDDSGRVELDAVDRLLPLISWNWASSDTSPRRIPQPGVLVLLTAHAVTAPTSDNCTVGVTLTTPWSGEELIATCEIRPGQFFSQETRLAYDVDAGSLLRQTVITANGASGISIFASMRVT